MTPASAGDQDRADMARLNAGHDGALDDLMGRHGARLFHYLIRALQNEDEAADIAQEAFTRVYQNRGKFDSRQTFAPWLYAIATNLVKDRYRYRIRHPQVSLDVENQETGMSFKERLVDPAAIPGEGLQSSERAAAVREAIAALPEELRLPLILAEFEERTQAEIGQILGCTAKAVETRIYRARQQLRVSLGEFLRPR